MVNVVEVDKVEGDSKLLSRSTRQYILIFITSLIGAISGLLFQRGFLLFGIIAILLYISAFIAHIFFIKGRNLIISSTIINSVTLTAPFISYISPLFFIAVLALVFLLFNSISRGNRASENMVKIHFFRVGRIAGSSAISAVVIFLSAILILSSSFTISPERTSQIISALSVPISRFVPNFTPDMTVRALLTEVALKEAASDAKFAVLPKSVQKQVIDVSVIELEKKVEEALGVEVALGQSVTSNVHSIIQFKLNSLTPQAKLYWSIAAIGLVWLSLKSTEVILYIPILILAFLLYELFLAAKFARIENISVTKEVIVID